MSRHPRQPLPAADGIGQVLAAKFLELGLVVEQIQLRRAAGLEQVDHTLRLRREMRQVRQAARRRFTVALRRSGPAIFLNNAARAAVPRLNAAAVEKMSACELQSRCSSSGLSFAAHCFVDDLIQIQNQTGDHRNKPPVPRRSSSCQQGFTPTASNCAASFGWLWKYVS